jgi:subtilisin family serine protease
MTQYLVIPSGGDLPTNETTEIVHTYDNGDRLIRIEQPTVEAGSGTITETGGGLALPDVSQEELALARNSLETLPMIEGAPPLPAYVEFAGPIDGTWLEILREHKVKPLRFQPVDSYLVRGTADALREVAKLPIVRRVIPLARNLKFSVPAPEAGGIDVIISILAAVEESEQIVTELDDLPGVTVDRNQSFGRTGPYLRILALITNEGRENLLKYPLVERIDSFETPRLEDEVSSLILAGQYRNNGQPNGSYLNWLEIQGLNGRNVIIGIVDAGVEEDHPAFTGRITALDGGRRTWHGTMVAGHAAGRYLDERDSDNFIYGLGIAPASELLSQDFSDATVTPQRVCRETVHHGSTIQNNSWGTSTRNPMDYGTLEADYDALVRNANPDGEQPQPLTICFSVGNQGAAGITRPKAAKNIIVTGNSENYRPHEGGAESNNIDQVYTGPDPSSYGNCGDKRIRPHVVAPGEWTASASYNSPSVYRVSDLITWGGGSSGASPKTAGACALLTQWWQRNNNGAAPSPALLRALIVNGAVDTFFGGAIPNMRQGWGRLNVANVLRQDVPHTYIDQSVLLRRRGDSLSLPLRVGDLSQPVKITLAWTDPPGPPGSGSSTKSPSPLVNQLALRVNINGTTYNLFSAHPHSAFS